MKKFILVIFLLSVGLFAKNYTVKVPVQLDQLPNNVKATDGSDVKYILKCSLMIANRSDLQGARVIQERQIPVSSSDTMVKFDFTNIDDGERINKLVCLLELDIGTGQVPFYDRENKVVNLPEIELDKTSFVMDMED